MPHLVSTRDRTVAAPRLKPGGDRPRRKSRTPGAPGATEGRHAAIAGLARFRAPRWADLSPYAPIARRDVRTPPAPARPGSVARAGRENPPLLVAQVCASPTLAG